MVVNLLEETKRVLRENKHSIGNTKFIKNAEGYISVADFVTAAQNFSYNNELERPQVDPTLVLVGKFWWLSRMTINGVEQWIFHTRPKKPELPAIDFTLKNTR